MSPLRPWNKTSSKDKDNETDENRYRNVRRARRKFLTGVMGTLPNEQVKDNSRQAVNRIANHATVSDEDRHIQWKVANDLVNFATVSKKSGQKKLEGINYTENHVTVSNRREGLGRGSAVVPGKSNSCLGQVAFYLWHVVSGEEILGKAIEIWRHYLVGQNLADSSLKNSFRNPSSLDQLNL